MGNYEDDIQFVRFTGLKPIADGEEIFQNYGDEYWATLWEIVWSSAVMWKLYDRNLLLVM